jgi:hypothetical protein
MNDQNTYQTPIRQCWKPLKLSRYATMIFGDSSSVPPGMASAARDSLEGASNVDNPDNVWGLCCDFGSTTAVSFYIPPSTHPFEAHHTQTLSADGLFINGPHNSSTPQQVRHTPSTLGWVPNTELMNLYTFVAVRGKEPYFELPPIWTETQQTPHRVYLDSPK